MEITPFNAYASYILDKYNLLTITQELKHKPERNNRKYLSEFIESGLLQGGIVATDFMRFIHFNLTMFLEAQNVNVELLTFEQFCLKNSITIN